MRGVVPEERLTCEWSGFEDSGTKARTATGGDEVEETKITDARAAASAATAAAVADRAAKTGDSTSTHPWDALNWDPTKLNETQGNFEVPPSLPPSLPDSYPRVASTSSMLTRAAAGCTGRFRLAVVAVAVAVAVAPITGD